MPVKKAKSNPRPIPTASSVRRSKGVLIRRAGDRILIDVPTAKGLELLSVRMARSLDDADRTIDKIATDYRRSIGKDIPAGLRREIRQHLIWHMARSNRPE